MPRCCWPAGNVDVLILGALEQAAAAPALLRELRAGTLDPRAWLEPPTITLAPLVSADGELDALRVYEAASDHHVPAGAGYLHQRGALEAVARRARGATRRVHRVGRSRSTPRRARSASLAPWSS